jgi:hypothetical protein
MNIEEVWEALLSENPAAIRKLWMDLTDDEALAVLEHLKRMASEEGWQPAQKQAAETALRVIRDIG